MKFVSVTFQFVTIFNLAPALRIGDSCPGQFESATSKRSFLCCPQSDSDAANQHSADEPDKMVADKTEQTTTGPDSDVVESELKTNPVKETLREKACNWSIDGTILGMLYAPAFLGSGTLKEIVAAGVLGNLAVAGLVKVRDGGRKEAGAGVPKSGVTKIRNCEKLKSKKKAGADSGVTKVPKNKKK